MTQNTRGKGKDVRRYMRYLHNKIGYFIVGMVLIYGLSGILQTYRDTNLLKHEVLHHKKLSLHLSEAQLGSELKIRNIKATKMEGSVLYFKDGSYNMETGEAQYVAKEWHSWVVPFTELHKTASKKVVHYFTVLFAVALLFMSVSAFWMFKPGTKLFSSGIYLTIGGIVASVILLILANAQ